MAKIEGGVPVAGFLCTTDGSDTYPVTVEEFHKGGYRTVENYTEMQNIPEERRKYGMWVFVKDENKDYRLLENGFVPFSPSGGEGGSSAFNYE